MIKMEILLLVFFAQRSHRVISVDNCLLHSEAFNPIIDCFTDFANEYKLTPYDEKSHSGLFASSVYASCNGNRRNYGVYRNKWQETSTRK